MLKNRQELQSLREICQKALAAEEKKILVCTGTGCVSGGSLDVYAELVRLMKDAGIACSVELQKDPHGDEIRVTKGGCPGDYAPCFLDAAARKIGDLFVGKPYGPEFDDLSIRKHDSTSCFLA